MILNLLILCGILSQVFIGNFADQDIRKSSDLLLRQKRVISRIPGEDIRVSMYDAPFIVRLRYNNRITCIGNILSHHIVITIASCVPYDKSQYKLVAKSKFSDMGISYNVSDIDRYYGRHPGRSTDGIALLKVDPPFEFGESVRNIGLHSGLLVNGTLGTIVGWGFNCIRSSNLDRGTQFPRILRSIEVPIMNHRDCVDRYRPHNIMISDKDICTFHPHRHCGHNDGGAPLVVEGELAGVHLWTGPDQISPQNPEFPEVFALLQHSEYINWIRTKIRSIEAQYNRH